MMTTSNDNNSNSGSGGGNSMSTTANAATSTTNTVTMVYLFTYPPMPHCMSASPFALKVESFLRVYKIPYELKYTLFGGSKSTIPYIRFNDSTNGEEINDTNLIIPRLMKEFHIDESTILTTEQMAVSHATLRMVEEHTMQYCFYYRYGLHIHDYYNVLDIPHRLFKSDTSWFGKLAMLIVPNMSSKYSMKKMKYRGLLDRFSNDEMWKFSFDDLQAISNYLGETKKWFHGGDSPTTIDCVLYGHLSQFLYIPLEYPQVKYIQEHCPNLIRYVDRFRDTYYPDFEEKCKEVEADMTIRPEKTASKKEKENNTSGWLSTVGTIAIVATVAIAAGIKFQKT